MNFEGRKKAVADSLLVMRVIGIVRGKLVQDFIITAGSNFGIAFCGAIGGILAARLLGPEGRGELAAAVVWAGILGTVAQLGLPQSLTYSTARDPASIGSIFVSMMVVLVIQSIGALTIGWIAVRILVRFQPAAMTAIRIYLFSIPFSLLTTYLSTVAQGLKRFGLFNAIRTASSVMYVSSLVVGLVFGLRRASDVVTLLLISQAIVALAAMVWFYLALRPSGHFDPRRVRQLLAYGLKSYLGNLSWMANARLDQFLMSAFVRLDALGHYAVAVSYATILFPLSGAFANVMFPHVAAGERYKAGNTIMRALKLNVVISSSGAVILALLCPRVLPWIFGSDFSPAVYPAIVLLGGTVLLGCNYVLSDGLRGLGYPLLPSLSEAVGVMVTAGGLFYLLPRFGIMGAAWASVASYGAVLIVLSMGLIRVIGKRSDTV